MNTTDAQRLAGQLMREYGLLEQGWTQVLDRSVKRFGQCQHGRKRLSFSRPLIEHNDEAMFRDTVLHEIAHALVGPGQGHNEVWKRMARTIGAKPDRCATGNGPPPKWIGTCPNCGATSRRERLTDKAKKAACAKCCRGTYNPDFRFRWASNMAGAR